MSILDAIVLIVLISFGVTGLKRGFFKQTIIFVGTIIVLVVAYKLKNIVGDFLLFKMPFINIPIRGAQSLNIIFYQAIGFMIVTAILLIIFKVIIAITGLFEKILKWTIVLGIPSKILGFIVGLIEGWVVIFIFFFILSQPVFDDTYINDSKLAPMFLNSPVLKGYVSDGLVIIEEAYRLKDITDENELNSKILDMCLEKNIVTADVVDKLIEDGKIDISNKDVLNKYR